MYLLFAGSTYYPGEGISDLRMTGDSSLELIKIGKASLGGEWDWYQIVDTTDWRVVAAEGGREDPKEINADMAARRVGQSNPDPTNSAWYELKRQQGKL